MALAGTRYAMASTATDRYACRELPSRPDPRPLDHRRADPSKSHHRVERALLQADAIALSLRSALDRILLPLARAASAFVQGHGWTEFGFARLDDFARERLGRSGRSLRDYAALGCALRTLPDMAARALGVAIDGDDGHAPVGRVAAFLIARAVLRTDGEEAARRLPAWLALARSLPVRELRETLGSAAAGRASESTGSAVPDESTCSTTTGLQHGAEASEDRSLLRVPVPAAVLAAFDETVDLFRAVEGMATVTSFVEALVAESTSATETSDFECGVVEAAASHFDADPDRVSIRRGEDAAIVESALARTTGNWRRLARSSPASWALSLAGSSLAHFNELARSAGTGDAVALDGQLRALFALENDLEGRLGRLLAEMAERGAWSRLRFAGVGHYAEQRLGLSRTAAEDRARAARSLRRYPLLRSAYEAGRFGLDAVLLVLRQIGDGPVSHDLEEAWVARAGETTVKRLRDEARALGRRRGHGESLPAAGPLDDAEWHASLRRAPGTARERVLAYGRVAAERITTGRRALPGPDVFLRLTLPDWLASDFAAAIERNRGALAGIVARVRWDEPWPDSQAAPSVAAARGFFERGRRVPAWVGLLAMLEDFVCTWDAADSTRRDGDDVYKRDGWRCMAPGCTSRRNLDAHHLIYRSRNGGDEPSNRLCICRFHHQRGEHGGLAACSGTAPVDVYWRLGRPDVGVWYLNERRLAGPQS